MNSKTLRRQIAGLLLIITLVNLAFPPLNTYAAKAISKQKTAKELEKTLEQQYGIEIILPSSLLKNDERAYIYLADLREALCSMPEAFVLAVVKHFKSKGKATTFSFSSDISYMNSGYNGVYNNKSNTITLMNSTPSIILQEFGHMVQEALNHKYGYSKLKSEFTALNKKIPYGKWKDDYFIIFASEYANTSFEEDFAEMFAYSIALSHNIREVYEKKKDASLIKKSTYIKKIIESTFKVQISQDMWRIYPQTPSKKYASIEEEYGYTGTYQYKVTKADFYLELRKLWKEISEDRMNLGNTIKIGQVEEDFKKIDGIQKEYDVFFEPYASKMTGKIKRKEVAVILADVMKHFSVSGISDEKTVITDCDNLDSKYKNAIIKVTEAGFMLTSSKDEFSPESYCNFEQVYYAMIHLYSMLGE